jgi:diguanylate cyclase (GGDEF)-like protein/PAS domain S-box-containing protein
VLPDVRRDARFGGSSPVPTEPAICFYAGVPLVSDEGLCIGTLCVMDYQPRRLSDAQRSALDRLASLVPHVLQSRRRRRPAARMGQILALAGQKPSLPDVPALLRSAEVRASPPAEEVAFQRQEFTEAMLNAGGDAVIATDKSGRVSLRNSKAESLTGWSNAQAHGRPLDQVIRVLEANTRQPMSNPLRAALAGNHRVDTSNVTLVARDGMESKVEGSAVPIHDRAGRVVGGVLVCRGVGDTRATALHLTRMAQHDFLTGLPNRVLLLDRVAQAIVQARRSRGRVALLFVDLDHFKHVNDSLGHDSGDRLLREVADRLRACVRASDTVCRQGGDEFVVLLPDAHNTLDVLHVAEKLLEACGRRFAIDGQDVHVGASIGISLFPEDGQDGDALTRNADAAMYHAKGLGRNNVQFYTPDMNARAKERLALESSLRRALQQGEFVLHYQPIRQLTTQTVIGCEALLRWQDPLRGLVGPTEFLPLIEDSALMVPISQWVLREACRQNKAWQVAGLAPIPVAVNLSSAQFKHKDFLASVTDALELTGLDPQYLELEFTEGIVMNDRESTVGVLRSLRDLGVRISIDDFGTGYSSLSQLRRFPIVTLKIDQSFVRDLSAAEDDAATITSAIISMAKTLRYRVVAEGVESRAQMDFLQARGCDAMQGFYYKPPLPAIDLALLLPAASAADADATA